MPVGDLRVRGDALVGGVPRRLLRLTGRGSLVAQELLAGAPATTADQRLLGRRLVDAGLVRPYPPATTRPTVTVVVPVKDRDLTACLDALGDRDPVIVVDDGSARPVHVDRAHVTVVRQDNRGPAAARNAGIARATTDVVACVDSDLRVRPGWLEPLLQHLADPAVAAVAPRIRPVVRDGALGRYLDGRPPLDLGPRDLPVRPGSPVPYVPSAALVLRRELARFDEDLRTGEDVDLVWRLVGDGHDVRYDPTVEVDHVEPTTWREVLRRRHSYGRSATPLHRRHPDELAHLRAAPLPLLAASAAAVAPLPVAALAAAVTTAATAKRLEDLGLPTADALSTGTAATGQATEALARWLLVSGAGALAPRLLVVPALADWVRRRPRLDPLRWTAAHLADDLAYATGVWRSALEHGDLGAIVPRVTAQSPPWRSRSAGSRTSG